MKSGRLKKMNFFFMVDQLFCPSLPKPLIQFKINSRWKIEKDSKIFFDTDMRSAKIHCIHNMGKCNSCGFFEIHTSLDIFSSFVKEFTLHWIYPWIFKLFFFWMLGKLSKLNLKKLRIFYVNPIKAVITIWDIEVQPTLYYSNNLWKNLFYFFIYFYLF